MFVGFGEHFHRWVQIIVGDSYEIITIDSINGDNKMRRAHISTILLSFFAVFRPTPFSGSFPSFSITTFLHYSHLQFYPHFRPAW